MQQPLKRTSRTPWCCLHRRARPKARCWPHCSVAPPHICSSSHAQPGLRGKCLPSSCWLRTPCMASRHGAFIRHQAWNAAAGWLHGGCAGPHGCGCQTPACMTYRSRLRVATLWKHGAVARIWLEAETGQPVPASGQTTPPSASVAADRLRLDACKIASCIRLDSSIAMWLLQLPSRRPSGRLLQVALPAFSPSRV